MNKVNYIEIHWKIKLTEEESAILSAHLLNIGFDSFYEGEDGFKAYIQAELFSINLFAETLTNLDFSEKLIGYYINKLEQKNWNEEWEKNFEPILVANSVFIKAPFHTVEFDAKYKIIIHPQMSFGTGHHETTSGMIEMMLNVDFKDKTVLDMGAGTGILAIFASMLKAKTITAIDNDIICYENSIHNINLNNIQNVKVLNGDVKAINDSLFDVIIANINKNTLLQDISQYAKSLQQNGLLLLSGFYIDDLEEIELECKKSNLFLEKNIDKNNWCITLYKKL